MKMIVSASCSMAPDSRRSESCGRLSFVVRVSTARLSCESAITGTFSSFASCFERAGDLADLLLAAVDAVAALHELEVVEVSFSHARSVMVSTG
jgi:hypothetical protein